MSKFSVGDMVMIIDSFEGFSTFTEWLIPVPELLARHHFGVRPADGSIGRIVHIAPHTPGNEGCQGYYGDLLAVDVNGEIYIMSQQGVEMYQELARTSNLCREIVNPQKATPNPHREIIHAALTMMQTKALADYQLSKACGMMSSVDFFTLQLESIKHAIAYNQGVTNE